LRRPVIKVLARQVAYLFVDLEQAFLLRHLDLEELGLQDIVGKVHVRTNVFFPTVAVQFLVCEGMQLLTVLQTSARVSRAARASNWRVVRARSGDRLGSIF
jgi:hypothetical protein